MAGVLFPPHVPAAPGAAGVGEECLAEQTKWKLEAGPAFVPKEHFKLAVTEGAARTVVFLQS